LDILIVVGYFDRCFRRSTACWKIKYNVSACFYVVYYVILSLKTPTGSADGPANSLRKPQGVENLRTLLEGRL
jgi:hypothetical protein